MQEQRRVEILENYLADRGLKNPRQRKAILDVFFRGDKHHTVDDLLEEVNRDHPNISYTTVYRTMKLLVRCGLASERHFGDGLARYEPTHADEHHDHLICIACGKIIEFENDDIERLQEEVATQHNFQMLNHRMEIYGRCAECVDQH